MRKSSIRPYAGSIAKGVLAVCLTAAMAVPAVSVSKADMEKTSGGMEPAFSRQTQELEKEAERIEKRAIAKYDFESDNGIANMNSSSTSSEVKEVTGCSSVLVLGSVKKSVNVLGVELVNPYAGKKEYVETLTDALRNNGVTYNGKWGEGMKTDSQTGALILDTEVMPLEGKTYPYPKWEKGFTVSVWARVPEGAKADTPLFSFCRRLPMLDKCGGLGVTLGGTTIFTEGYGGEEAGRNTYNFAHNFDGLDPHALAGKWVQVTITIENDGLGVYFNGKKATGKKQEGSSTQVKWFNKGFGYPGYADPTTPEFYKNYRDLLKNFSEEEKQNGDFSDFSKYYFLNSDKQTIIEVLTDENTQLFAGGDEGRTIFKLMKYTDDSAGVMLDDMLFFDEVLTGEEVAALYDQSDKRSDDLTGENPVRSPEPSEEPKDSEEPSEEPTDSETPSEEPKESEEPAVSPSASEKPSQEPSVSPAPSPQPVKRGDLDGDGGISLKDAQIALRAALHLVTLDEKQKAAADVDGVEGIGLKDAQTILRAALHLITL